MIRIKNLYFSYKKDKNILNNINICFDKGFIGVLGPNGCGKSTLMKVISGILSCFEGEIEIFGKNINIMRKSEISQNISYLPQNMTYDPDMTVIESLISVMNKYFIFEPKLSQKIDVIDALNLFDLKRVKNNKLSELSGGELQRVFIAMGFLKKTKIHIFDEPLNNLDIKHQLEIIKILKNLSKTNMVVLVFHDINIALNFCDKIVLMKNGEIFCDCAPFEISSDFLKKIFEIECNIFNFDNKKIVFLKEVYDG
ncbi:MAG: ABC transporter ATP-binding protein [Endomicrobia bacterium]|nr:ABC transporter ATP-binding protein [Endomicrobiia bacterium]